MKPSNLPLLRGWRPAGPLDVCFGDSGDSSAHSVADAERIFFGGLQLSNGTYKTTAAHRLDDVNELVYPHLPERRPLRVMDVAVSSGVTAAEWSDQLRAEKIDHDLIATDLAVDGQLLTVGKRAAVLWEENGPLLAVQLGRHTLYLQRSARRRVIKAGLAAGLDAVRFAASRRDLAPAGAPPSPWAIKLRSVPLVTRRLVLDPSIRIVSDDITHPGRFVGEADVCRAANILNRVYFSEQVIRVIVQNLLDRIRKPGLLIVCRTLDDEGRCENQATVFRVNGQAVTVLSRLGGGSEVEDLVVSVSQGLSDRNRADRPSA